MKTPANKAKSGRFQPGQSGNPNGRPKNPFGELIRKQTNNGQEIVDKVLNILRNAEKNADVMWAAEWLRDTGYGKPAQAIALTDTNGLDLGSLLSLTAQARIERGLEI
jgi:2-hydroxychromene-2-carboxylate isomerase